MANVGQLSANLTLGTAQFNGALEEAQGRTGKFQNAAGGGSGQFTKFNGSMLESRKAMKLLGEAAGVNLGAMRGFAMSFGMFGPAAGAAVVGFMLLQKYITSTAEALKKATEDENRFTDVLRKLRMDSEGLEFNRAAREAKELGKELDKITQAMTEAKDNGFFGNLSQSVTSAIAGIVNTIPGIHLPTFNENREDDADYKGLQTKLIKGQAAYQKILDDAKVRGESGPDIVKKDSEKHGGAAAAHILKAVRGEELGALKLQHGNPMVDLLKKSVDLQEKTLQVLQKAPVDPLKFALAY